MRILVKKVPKRVPRGVWGSEFRLTVFMIRELSLGL